MLFLASEAKFNLQQNCLPSTICDILQFWGQGGQILFLASGLRAYRSWHCVSKTLIRKLSCTIYTQYPHISNMDCVHFITVKFDFITTDLCRSDSGTLCFLAAVSLAGIWCIRKKWTSHFKQYFSSKKWIISHFKPFPKKVNNLLFQTDFKKVNCLYYNIY